MKLLFLAKEHAVGKHQNFSPITSPYKLPSFYL